MPREISTQQTWDNIGLLCYFASLLDKPSDLTSESRKEMATLFADLEKRLDHYCDKQASLYQRFVLLGKVVPVVTQIYWEVKHGEVLEPALGARLVSDVLPVVEKYLGDQGRLEESVRITEEKIIENLLVEAKHLSLRGGRGPALLAAENVGKLLGLKRDQSEKSRKQSKKVITVEEHDPQWNYEPLFMLDGVLRNIFGASDEQVLQILKVFGAQD